MIVDGSTFFWLMVLRNRSRCCCDWHCYCGCNFGEPASRRLFVIKEGGDGKLEIALRVGHREQVTPGDVEFLIRSSLAEGWDPGTRGRTVKGPIDANSIPSARRREDAQLKIVEEIMLL